MSDKDVRVDRHRDLSRGFTPETATSDQQQTETDGGHVLSPRVSDDAERTD